MANNVDKINGKRYSHANIVSDFAKITQKGIPEINYSETLTPGVAEGTDPADQGTTDGRYKAKASVTFLREEFDEMVLARAAASGTNSWMDYVEDVSVSFAQLGKLITTDELVGFKFTGSDLGSSGSDPTKVKCDAYIKGIIRFPPGCPEGGILPFAGFER